MMSTAIIRRDLDKKHRGTRWRSVLPLPGTDHSFDINGSKLALSRDQGQNRTHCTIGSTYTSEIYLSNAV